MMFENVCMPTGNRFSRFVSISAKHLVSQCLLFVGKVTKKKLEFACLSSFFLLVAQHSLHTAGKELLAQYNQRLYIKRRCGCVASFFVLVSRKISMAMQFPCRKLGSFKYYSYFCPDICKWLNSFGLLSQ